MPPDPAGGAAGLPPHAPSPDADRDPEPGRSASRRAMLRAQTQRTTLWMLLYCTVTGVLLAVFGMDFDRADATDCHRSDSAEACYRRGLRFAVRAMFTAVEESGDAEKRERLRDQAEALMRGSCDRGYATACNGLARQLLIRHVLDPDVHKRAADLYQKGCSARSPSRAACNGLGEAYAYALGRPHDEAQALASFRRACDLGHATACFRAAGRIRRQAERGRWALDEANRLTHRACDRGSMTGCLDRAAALDRGLRQVDPERYGRRRYEADRTFVMDTYGRACDAKFFVGCHNLGRIYQDSVLGVPRDTARARSYFARACDVRGAPERGRSLACKALGDLGLAQGAPAARVDTLYRAGCRMFAPEACVELARLWARGGLRPDSTLLLAVTACVQRYAPGCALAAELYQRPPLADSAVALRYRHRVCDLGDVAECAALGTLWSASDSVGRTFKYYRRACALPGGAQGCALLRQEAEMRAVAPSCGAAGARCARPRRTRMARMGIVRGTLGPGDAVLPADGSRYDELVVHAPGGKPLRVTLASERFDAHVSIGWLQRGEFVEFWSNDDAAEDLTHAHVVLIPPRPRDLVIRVNTFGPEQYGDYLLFVEPAR